ncbi:U32 family peptidase C-terminal domain-containing protein, partial [Pseudomonas aeruginosa]
QQFVGEFTGVRRDGWAEVDVKNKFALGDSVEMMTPGGNVVFTLESMQNKKGEPIEVAPGNGHIVYLPIPQDIDLNYALLIRNLAEENSAGA